MWKGRITFLGFNLRGRLVSRSQVGKLRPISVRSHRSSSSTPCLSPPRPKDVTPQDMRFKG